MLKKRRRPSQTLSLLQQIFILIFESYVYTVHPLHSLRHSAALHPRKQGRRSVLNVLVRDGSITLTTKFPVFQIWLGTADGLSKCGQRCMRSTTCQTKAWQSWWKPVSLLDGEINLSLYAVHCPFRFFFLIILSFIDLFMIFLNYFFYIIKTETQVSRKH